MDSEPPVKVEGLRKSFGRNTVLNGISFEVEAARILTVLGRSGTGKSVLLRLLIGLEKPDAGSICLDGQEITKLPRQEMNETRKKVGFLFQQAALYDSMTIAENVAFPLRRHTRLSESELAGRVKELLANVGLEGDLNKMPSEISGGMRKRVGLARALALEPKIVMFDEPTAGLDPITAAEIGKLILDLRDRHGITSIVVTHDLHSARSISDRMVLLHEGDILVQGSFDDLSKSKDQFVAQFLKDAA